MREGDRVQLTFEQDEAAFRVLAPTDGVPGASFVSWPASRSLGYHFPMIADTTRNGCFDRAIINHLRKRPAAAAHVLDIGSGSGLLAMMAARAGAQQVVSLEMVPQLAAAARHIVDANGYGDAVSVVGQMSTSVQPAEVGGRFDLLVCEIVDDQLLGEGCAPRRSNARHHSIAW